MRLVRIAALASLPVLAASPALAQAPQVEKNVSMAMAIAIMQGAIEQCTKDGYKVTVVIVDKGGNVAASVRGDGRKARGRDRDEVTKPRPRESGPLKAEPELTRKQTSQQAMKQIEEPADA